MSAVSNRFTPASIQISIWRRASSVCTLPMAANRPSPPSVIVPKLSTETSRPLAPNNLYSMPSPQTSIPEVDEHLIKSACPVDAEPPDPVMLVLELRPGNPPYRRHIRVVPALLRPALGPRPGRPRGRRGARRARVVAGHDIGRASCRERGGSPV